MQTQDSISIRVRKPVVAANRIKPEWVYRAAVSAWLAIILNGIGVLVAIAYGMMLFWQMMEYSYDEARADATVLARWVGLFNIGVGVAVGTLIPTTTWVALCNGNVDDVASNNRTVLAWLLATIGGQCLSMLMLVPTFALAKLLNVAVSTMTDMGYDDTWPYTTYAMSAVSTVTSFAVSFRHTKRHSWVNKYSTGTA